MTHSRGENVVNDDNLALERCSHHISAFAMLEADISPRFTGSSNCRLTSFFSFLL